MGRPGANNIQSWIAALALAIFGFHAVASDDLDHPWTDGLYSTVTAPFVQAEREPRLCRKVKLEVPGFEKKLEVLASMQDGAADLVVILNGTFSKSDNPYASLWTAWLEEQGRHVLTFDSVMNKPFVVASRHGVPGNLEVEAERAAAVIQAFLQSDAAQGKIRRIGIVGISYGGTLALQLARLEAEGRLPFRTHAIRAYSAPVSFAQAIRRLDSYFSFKYTKVDLYTTFSGRAREWPLSADAPGAEAMRCAIARSFREDLKYGIEFHDRFFGKELEKLGAPRLDLPRDNGLDLDGRRIYHAEAMSFEHYFNGLVAPYWQARDARWTRERLLGAGELGALLPRTVAHASAVLTVNDPLNTEGAVEALAQANAGKVTVLPRGGHLGFFDAAWTRRDLGQLFERRSEALAKR